MEPSTRDEQDGWWRLGRAVLGAVRLVAFRSTVAGEEHVPRSGGALMASNHVSVLDPVAVALAVSPRGRTVHYLALAETFDQPVVGWVLRRTGQIPLRRGIGDWRAIEDVAAIARRGGLVGVSAEGTVGHGEALQPIQKGAARIALAARVPIIPTAVWGTQHRWPRAGLRACRPMRVPLAVVFGRPIAAVGDPRSRADVRDLTDRLAAGIEGAVAEARARLDGSKLV